ncbi:MAG: hypothetical protein IJ038_02270 [Clostridia bacterium]|nr:hypothetical protein [Clostridia bacterium]
MIYKGITLPNETVTPQSFGAVGDGRADDLAMLSEAAAYAREKKCILELPSGSYYTSDTLVLEGVMVLSRDAEILYNGHRLDAPGVYVGDGTAIYGNLRIDANDDPQDHYGQRAGMAFGDFYTGVGSHRCYVESVELTGGIKNANGIVITGDCSDIRIDRVFIPEGTNICRGVCIHWGNRRAHHTVDAVGTGFAPDMKEKGYIHEPDGGPTTHPHGIYLGRVECSGFRPLGTERSDSDKAAVIVCAGYDISVDEIVMHDSCHAFAVTGADNGFEYADRAVRELEPKNIYVKKITGTAMRSAGVFLIDYPWYLNDARVNMHVRIDECFVEAAPCNRNVGVEIVGVESAEFGSVTVRNYQRQAFDILGGAKNVAVCTLNVESCKGEAVFIRDGKGKSTAEKVSFGKINITSDSAENISTLYADGVKELSIGNISVSVSK